MNDNSTVDFLSAVKEYDGREIPLITHKDIGGKGGFELYGYMRYPDQHILLLLEPVLFWSGGRRGMSTPSANGYTPEVYREILLKARTILQGVDLHQVDASEFITEFGSDPNNFLYIDPPYLGADVGVYVDSKKERKRMINAIANCKCSWLLSEYRCDDLDDAFGKPIARIYSYADAGSGSNSRREMIECLYSNYQTAPVVIDFGDSQTVLQASTAALRKCKGIATYDSWREKCPVTWRDSFCKKEFAKLVKQPWTYFDGKNLMLLK